MIHRAKFLMAEAFKDLYARKRLHLGLIDFYQKVEIVKNKCIIKLHAKDALISVLQTLWTRILSETSK